MTNEFYNNGHHYKVVKIENSTDYIIIKDGRHTKRVDEKTANQAAYHVNRLF